MKVTIPEIAWHNRDPVFSADFSPADGQSWRMATAGADADVKVKLGRLEETGGSWGNEGRVTLGRIGRHGRETNW